MKTYSMAMRGAFVSIGHCALPFWLGVVVALFAHSFLPFNCICAGDGSLLHHVFLYNATKQRL
jgi:hypothetical protein